MVAAVLAGPRVLTQTKTPITVYKDPNCGCCGKWVEHMDANGFQSKVINTNMATVHAEHKVPRNLQSCHTGIVGGFVIEGHVPASDVKKLLAQKPNGIRGLTIPGMPQSAPGMDLLPFQPYEVLTFTDAGATRLFARHTEP
jgi:hypothetical protein